MNINEMFGKSGTRIQPEVEHIIELTIKEFYFGKEPIKKISTIHELVIFRIMEENKKRDIEEQLKFPSISTIKRRIFSLTNPEMGAKQKIKKATYPLEKAWVDYTVLDVMVVDDKNLIYIGKPTLVTIVDEFSGYPLG
jgi:putative transposase